MSDATIPEPPSSGEVYGRKPGDWEAVMPLLGGHMRGPLHLWDAEPKYAEEAVSKAYVDRVAGGSGGGRIAMQRLPADLDLSSLNTYREIARFGIPIVAPRMLRIVVWGGVVGRDARLQLRIVGNNDRVLTSPHIEHPEAILSPLPPYPYATIAGFASAIIMYDGSHDVVVQCANVGGGAYILCGAQGFAPEFSFRTIIEDLGEA